MIETTIVIPLHEKLAGHVTRVHETGLYGQTPEETVLRLIERGIEEHFHKFPPVQVVRHESVIDRIQRRGFPDV